jgi:hypothetical protein
MDAATLINALRAGNTQAIVEAIEWDESDWTDLPDNLGKGFIGRAGLANVGLSPDGRLTVHAHDTEDGAHMCFAGNVEQIHMVVAEYVAMSDMPQTGMYV